MGRDRKTVEAHYRAAMKKMGRAAVQKPKTERLRTDRRGQEDVAGGDDRRG